MPNTSHTELWSSANPGLLIIMIDQSGSMNGKYIDDESKADFAAKAVNRLIQSIINKNFKGTQPLNRCKITVIGYNTRATRLARGYLSNFFKEPLEMVRLIRKVSDGAGGLVEQPFNMAIWLKAKHQGLTNMTEAFELAEDEIDQYFNGEPNCPAPIIINISDGIPCVENADSEAVIDIDNATTIAKRIANKRCKDGNVLIFNAHIEENGKKIELPDSKEQLPDEGARFLYEISSLIPESMKDAAGKSNLRVKPNSRGCMISCDAEALINLINFGSAKVLGDIEG